MDFRALGEDMTGGEEEEGEGEALLTNHTAPGSSVGGSVDNMAVIMSKEKCQSERMKFSDLQMFVKTGKVFHH